MPISVVYKKVANIVLSSKDNSTFVCENLIFPFVNSIDEACSALVGCFSNIYF